MAARFAAIEARLNRAVFRHVSNADATLAGLAVTGIFDAAYQSAEVGLSGMASTQPGFTLASASVPAGVTGLVLVHAGVSYTVVEHQPDGTGVSVLLLERAL